MRVAAVGLFFVTFAVTTWANRVPAATDPLRLAGPPGPVAEPTRPAIAAAGRPRQAGSSVAQGENWPPRFQFPDGCKLLGVRAEVSDELAGRLTLGTKVDVLLFPRDPSLSGPSELVVVGVFVVPHSSVDTLGEKIGAAVPQIELVCLAVTDQQAQIVAQAEERGRFRVVPAE